MAGRVSAVLVVTVLTAALAGCSDTADGADNLSTTPGPTPSVTARTPSAATSTTPTKPPRTTPKPKAPKVVPSSAASTLAIPSIKVSGLRVVPYTGKSDDGPGTKIQNKGVAASPRGPRGGVGPGEIGNFLVTAHRTTHGRPFGRLPDVRTGQHILVSAGGFVYDYVVTETMEISFRSATELARQHAAVPGRPGQRPTRAMITLSTCATPEDHAKGNYWSDEFGNPEHRINKIGVLVAKRPA